MAEVTITRTAIIVVDEVGTNTYGDLTFTDKAGAKYEVGNTRKRYFEKTIVPGAAVQLNYTSNPHKVNTEYIYNAELVKDKLPPEVKPSKVQLEDKHLEGGAKDPPTKTEATGTGIAHKDKMTIDDWAEKDRITRKSIERQTALNNAVEVAKLIGADKVTSEKIIATARRFEAYLAGESRLVEEAKKLGATEIDPEHL